MTDLVIIGANNQAVTSSLVVAEKFSKKHRHVIEKIREIIAAENSAAGNFEVSSYVDNNHHTQPMFLMNRDGFTLLAMSFTGKQAMKFKMDYINAFNKMEEYIKKEKEQPKIDTLTPIQALLASVQHMADIEKEQMEQKQRTLALEQKIELMEQKQIQAEQELFANELADEPMKEMSTRDKIRQLVNQYAEATRAEHQRIWDRVYDLLYYNYHISIKSYTKEKKESWLNVAERVGFIDKIYIIISELVRGLKPNT